MKQFTATIIARNHDLSIGIFTAFSALQQLAGARGEILSVARGTLLSSCIVQPAPEEQSEEVALCSATPIVVIPLYSLSVGSR